MGTEPFHWSGDLATFDTLMSNVFVGRMSGPNLTTEQSAAAFAWINSIPTRPGLKAASDPQVVRGQALFADPAVGCATCHAGTKLTNNLTVAVGASMFQVPSLRSVVWRAPFMHNGCAPDLLARFTDATCGGADTHGKTSHLTPSQLDDLVAYLESILVGGRRELRSLWPPAPPLVPRGKAALPRTALVGPPLVPRGKAALHSYCSGRAPHSFRAAKPRSTRIAFCRTPDLVGGVCMWHERDADPAARKP